VRSEERAALAAAKARLDELSFYSRPVRLRRTVRILSAPWLFRLPWFSRVDGYTMWDLILLRTPLRETSADLICHELCHVWQTQHRPLAMPLSYLYRGYTSNPYEIEARRAVAETRRS
jgi:hypothetical protein